MTSDKPASLPRHRGPSWYVGRGCYNADVNFTGVVKIDDEAFNEFEIYAVDDNVYENTETFYIKTTNIKSAPWKPGSSIGFSI